MIGLEYIEYLFGGLAYCSSSKIRKRKNEEWKTKGEMYKIYEVGMWIAIPIITILLVAAGIASLVAK